MAKLVEIPARDWPDLQQLFAGNWPQHILGHSIIRNFVEWRQRVGDKDLPNVKVWALDGDWREDGTFLVTDRYQLFLYSLVDDDQTLSAGQPSRLEVALGLLDWQQGWKVSSFSAKHRRSVVRVVESKGLQREFDSATIFYHLPKAQASQLPLQVPDDLIIHPLSEADVPLADSLWPNRHSGSLYFLRRQRKWSPNLGVYRKHAEDGTEELLAWCFTLQAGALGALQVRDGHQGQGLGTLVTIAMAKLMSELDRDTCAFVGFENGGSRRIFEKLKFQNIDTIHWLRTYPVGRQESIWNAELDGDLYEVVN